MHLQKIDILSSRFPVRDLYPFHLEVIQNTSEIRFENPVTIFYGENGAGKSTLLQAIAKASGIYIWEELNTMRFERNRHEKNLFNFIKCHWKDSKVHGSFFGSDSFKHFSLIVDEWARDDPGQLEYFGGKSLVTQSHGQSIMSFFRSRYHIKGIYFMDEPETALSPKSQIELLHILKEMSELGHAQFIIATHSPILLTCANAQILTFNHETVRETTYEQTDHFQIYRDFLQDPDMYMQQYSQ